MVESAQTEGVPFIFLITIILTAGCATLRWLADSVEASGLGDGVTLLICLNIVSGKLGLYHHYSTHACYRST